MIRARRTENRGSCTACNDMFLVLQWGATFIKWTIYPAASLMGFLHERRLAGEKCRSFAALGMTGGRMASRVRQATFLKGILHPSSNFPGPVADPSISQQLLN